MNTLLKKLSVNFIATTFLVLFSNSLLALENKSSSLIPSPLCKSIAQVAQQGDLIFTAVDSYSYQKIAEDTLTWASHVGIIFNDHGNWVVYESRIPRSTITPLCDFLSRFKNENLAVKRFHQPIEEAKIATIKKAAANRLGYFYHTGFDYDNENRMFCSKYVYDIFLEVGIQVGKIETLRQLLDRNPKADLVFWKSWYLGTIPWERRTVTPASQLLDPQFVTVFELGTSNLF